MLHVALDPAPTKKQSSLKTLFSNRQGLQDKAYLFLLLFTLLLLATIAVFAFTQGDPARYVHGADSWGNVCGRQSNPAIANALLPGLDHTSRMFSFYFITNDIRIPFNPDIVRSERFASICVSECETRITECGEMLDRQGYIIDQGLVGRRLCTMLDGLILPQQLYYGSCVPAEIDQASSKRPLAYMGQLTAPPVESM